MKVPFLDLKAQYESIKDEINEAIQKVLDSCAFAGGPFVAEFEKNFAKFCRCEHCVGVGSGTEALWMALLALGVGPGDEVITVPNTFIATAEAISFCGATPVFVDIEERTYTMDPQKLAGFVEQKCKFSESTHQLINRSTKRPVRAVIPVHLFGQMADMDPIVEIARANGLFVIEDACQSHGAEYKGRASGSIGDAGCFSFYPGKNLGAYGEAGAIVTNNSGLAEKMAMFRDHGQSKKYYHKMIGWNARMDGIQGAVLNVKLKHLPAWNQARRENAGRYNELLTEANGIIKSFEAEYARHVYHVYAIRIQDRDGLIAKLAGKDIYCGIHYPVPVHLQDAYLNSGYKNDDLKISKVVSSELVSLPMYAELTEPQIEYVVQALKQIAGRS
jgi:dTDP-4-amino-4,6-dideoxygalactose transaminase